MHMGLGLGLTRQQGGGGEEPLPAGIYFVGSATNSVAGSTSGTTSISLTSLTGGIDTRAKTGDLVFVIYATGGLADRTLSITDGTLDYTLIGVEQYGNDAVDVNTRTAYKIMGAPADTSVTFGPTGSSAESGAMIVYVLRGVDQSNPLDVATTSATIISTGNPNPPSITPVTAGAYVVVSGSGADDATANAFDTPSDLTNFVTSFSTASTNKVSVGVGLFAWTSGAFDPVAWTGNSISAAASSSGRSTAFRPA